MKIKIEKLRERLISIFQNEKLTIENSEKLVDILIESSLLGQESHGVGRVPNYVKAIRSKMISPSINLKSINEKPSFISFDANKSIGPLAVMEVISRIEDKAKKNGVAIATIKNCGDIARLGTYVFSGAIDNFITIVMANDAGGNPTVAPFGSNKKFFSTNPIAIGIPNKTKPIVIDFATSEQAIGKIKKANRRHEKLHTKFLINKDNSLSDNPRDFIDNDAAILPFGGIEYGYKGMALSLMVEALAGALSGAGVSSYKHGEKPENAVFIMLINAKLENTFSSSITQLVNDLKSLAVHIPGSKDIDEIQEIDIDDITWNEIESLIE